MTRSFAHWPQPWHGIAIAGRRLSSTPLGNRNEHSTTHLTATPQRRSTPEDRVLLLFGAHRRHLGTSHAPRPVLPSAGQGWLWVQRLPARLDRAHPGLDQLPVSGLKPPAEAFFLDVPPRHPLPNRVVLRRALEPKRHNRPSFRRASTWRVSRRRYVPEKVFTRGLAAPSRKETPMTCQVPTAPKVGLRRPTAAADPRCARIGWLVPLPHTVPESACWG